MKIVSVAFIVILGAVVFTTLDQRHKFDVTVSNAGSRQVDDVIVAFDEFNFRFGLIPSSSGGRIGKTYGNYIGLWPDHIDVNWSDEDDKHQLRLSVPKVSAVAWRAKLKLAVKFNDNEVVVSQSVE